MVVKLFNHQQNALEKAREGNLALFHDCGTGKTLTALSIIDHWRQYYHQRSEAFSALVLCPKSIIEPAWIADCKKFMPHMSVVSLWSRKPKERLQRLASEHEIYVANFDTFKNIFDAIRAKEFKVVIVDESSKLKSHNSQITRAALAIAGVKTWRRNGKGFSSEYAAPHRYILSGTPAPNNMTNYWGQMNFIAPEKVFSSRFTCFTNRYFQKICVNPPGGFKYVFTKNKDLQDEFNRQMAPYTDVVTKEMALDLPDRIHEIRKVRLSDAEAAAYRKLRRELVLEFANEDILAASALTKIMKSRQLTSGFCYGDKTVHQIGKSKLTELKELLEEIGVSNGHRPLASRAEVKSETDNTANQANTETKSTARQVIIWCNFKYEMEIIANELKSAAVYWGSDDAGATAAINDFISGKRQYFVANPQSAGHGLTFVNCSYAVYFSLNYSYELHKQSQDRIHRIGQNTKCTYYYLIADKTIDQVIYEALSKKEEMSTKVLEHLKSADSNQLSAIS